MTYAIRDTKTQDFVKDEKGYPQTGQRQRIEQIARELNKKAEKPEDMERFKVEEL